MNEIDTLQPKPFRDVGPQLYAPRDDEDVVPNPFAIPPEWLAAWQAEADDRAAMEAAAAEVAEQEALKKASAETDKDNEKKTDGILASLSAAIPRFFHVAEEASKPSSKTSPPAGDKKSSGPEDWLKSAEDAVSGAFSGVGQQVKDTVSGAFAGVGEQAKSAVSGTFDSIDQRAQSLVSNVGGQAVTLSKQAGEGAGSGLGSGLMSSLTQGVQGLSKALQDQMTPLVGAAHEAVTPLVGEAHQVVGSLAHTAGQSATAGAQEQIKAAGTGLSVNTTTLVLGGVAVVGAIGLGAWLLGGNRRFGSFQETSTEELQKMLDRATWTRPTGERVGKPEVAWLEPSSKPKSARHAAFAGEDRKIGSFGSDASKTDSGLASGIAFVGGASALAVLAGYLLKSKYGSDKSASGAYGTGLSGSSPSGHIGHRSSWQKERQSAGTPNSLLMRSSPLHPFTLADALGLSKELLHLDPAMILGPSPTQKDHDDFFAGYPIGHKAGAANCDAARANKNGTVYLKDTTKTQSWDNGWLKGYYDGWIAEGCKASLPHVKTASGPEEDDFEAGEHPHGNDYWWATESTASGPDATWNYVFTYMDGTSVTDPTPTPNSQISLTDNLVPDTAKAAKAVKVERVRFPDNFKVTVWTADKGASGPPAVSTILALQSVLLPWQITAAANYKATHPNFGSDWQEFVRVLAITPEQIRKANAQYRPFAAADAVAAARAAQASMDPGAQWAANPTGLPVPPPSSDDDSV